MHELVQNKSCGVDSEVVYVGDSATDLDCLLSADIGICVRNEGEMSGEQTELRETLRRLAIGCQGIGCMKSDDLEANSTRGTQEIGSSVWWARDFDDILHSLVFRVVASTEKDNISCSMTRDSSHAFDSAFSSSKLYFSNPRQVSQHDSLR